MLVEVLHNTDMNDVFEQFTGGGGERNRSVIGCLAFIAFLLIGITNAFLQSDGT